jgi:Flp pilus assembly protein TadG
MNLSSRNSIYRRQQGAVAVELAIVLLVMASIFSVPLFYSIYFWHYTVAQKAAQNSARYLSTISAREMRSPVLAAAAANVASGIAQKMVVELRPGPAAPLVSVYCGADTCTGVGGRPLPTTVRVKVQMDLFDQFLGLVDTGQYGWPITVEAQMNYVYYAQN